MQGHKVRALVRREDERADALRRLGAEVVQGDLTDLASMHRAIEGCARIYFGMSVSAVYLEATVNTAAVARHHGVEAFVNMSGGGLLCGSASSHLAGTRTSRSVPVAKGDGSRVRSGLAAGGRWIRTSGSAPAATPLTDRGVKPQATAAGCHFGEILP